jgi:hypothetical protein
MRVIITGAAGEIGSELVEELSGKHEFCLIDQRPVAGHISITADLSKGYSWNQWRYWLRVPRYPHWGEAFKMPTLSSTSPLISVPPYPSTNFSVTT